MKAIGGYFNLELAHRSGFPHDDGILVNSGRNALELILRNLTQIRKIYVPFFTCASALEPVEKLGINKEFYSINEELKLKDNIILNEREYLLYTNYFGLMDNYCEHLAQQYKGHLIIDNAQSFFSKPIDGVPTLYSPRKFVGIPDGGIAINTNPIDGLQQDQSYDRCSHLLKRYDLGASEGYNDFHANSSKLINQPIKHMSKLTEALLRNIDFKYVKSRRTANFDQLHEVLGHTNKLSHTLFQKIDVAKTVSLIYPFWIENGKEIRKRLISEQIFVATYWPNVFDWCKPEQLEYQMAENILAIPIDQRYDAENMKKIVNIINTFA